MKRPRCCGPGAAWLVVLWLSVMAAASVSATSLQPGGLRCEALEDPAGITVFNPRLSWSSQARDGKARGLSQTAYHILVASSPKLLARGVGDLWDTGKTNGSASAHIVYQGDLLMPRQECFWKVRVWDQEDRPSGWSEPGRWTMGLLGRIDWQARWIGWEDPAEHPDPSVRTLPARMLRREFELGQRVRRATLHASGLGLSELYVNGRRVGDQVLSPGLTDYEKRVLVVSHDVTGLVKKGRNAVGVLLGNGRYFAPRGEGTVTYGYPKLLLQMVVDHPDGSTTEILSDEAWNVTTDGPIRGNNEYDGETYDARMEQTGWAAPGFDDSGWHRAQLVKPPAGRLVGEKMPPIRVTERVQPVTVSEPRPGVQVFDFGQNLVGWCRMRVSGRAGTEVVMRHAETLKPDGTLYVENLRSALATDRYILKGKGVEVYEPRFTYHGFRYVELTGYPGKASLSTLSAAVVHDDLESTGQFECSNPLLNQLYRNIRWGLRGNYRSVPTDCPQRDERQAWLGDRAAESKGETYFFNIAPLYQKWLEDMADAQRETGSLPDVAPAYWPIYSDNVTWPSCAVIVPGVLWEQYGDLPAVERSYGTAAKWIDYMTRFVTNGIIARDSYGDWCVPPEEPTLIHSKDPGRKTDTNLLATAYFYHDLTLMAGYANALGKRLDARRFSLLADQVKRAFNDRFYQAEKGYYDNGTQTSCVLPLAFGLVTSEQRARVFEHLVWKIEHETDVHLATGLLGTQWLLRVLTENGRADLAYALATQRTYPSWGYMADRGATTVWELWNGDTADPAMNSGNHLMLVGDLGIWMFEHLAGIRPDPQQPGFKHILMQPQPVGDLRFVKASHRSPFGLIVSEWERRGAVFSWKIVIPPNTSATIGIPAASVSAVFESGKAAEHAPGVAFVQMEGGRAVFKLGSGTYAFESR